MTKDSVFTPPSFIHGIASVANLRGRILVNSSDSAEEADAKAITSDWNIVGKDILGAIEKYAESI